MQLKQFYNAAIKVSSKKCYYFGDLPDCSCLRVNYTYPIMDIKGVCYLDETVRITISFKLNKLKHVVLLITEVPSVRKQDLLM